MATSAVTKRAIEARRTEVARLIHRKLTLHQIAAILGVSYGTAQSDVKAVREEWRKERDRELSEHIAEELAVLNALQSGIWDGAASGKLFSVDRAIALSESRRRLLGLDAPSKRQVATDPDAPMTIVVRYEDVVDGNADRSQPA